MLKLFLLFTVLPALELYLLIKIGSVIGGPETVLAVIGMGVLGAWLAKREGLGVLREIQQDLARGLPPADRIVEGLMVLTGSVLLVTPGVITDIFAIVLLVPPLRRALAPVVRRWVVNRFLRDGGFVFAGEGLRFRVGSPQPRSGPVPVEPGSSGSSPPPGQRFDHPVA